MSALLTFFLALIISWITSFSTSAQAGWFGGDHHKNDATATAQPAQPTQEIPAPPATALEDNCGKYRKTIGNINSHHNVFYEAFHVPQREWALSRNQRCIEKTEAQEYNYLKNAQIKPDTNTADNKTNETAPPRQTMPNFTQPQQP